ncbi:hypothetical protein GF318_01305 [Candidatus Micrarchaeota archaeon]|nr:hypothetical protein [Candidatus Micrarchaeota archaeon]
MKALIFLLLLAGSAFSSSCIENATAIVIGEQGVNIGLVIGLTITLIAAAYMVGRVVGNPRYVVFAKDEAFHLFFSIFLLISFSGILVFACYFMDFFFVAFFEDSGLFGESGEESSCYVPGGGMHFVANCYASMAKKDADRLSKAYIQQYISYLMDSTFSWSVQIPLTNALTSTAGAYKRVISNQYDIIVNTFLIPALMSVSMQKIALDFITENVIRWVLPTAFLLRIFIPTRQLGNVIIALSVGIYVLVPFMYAFNFAMYEGVLTDCEEFAAVVCDNVTDDYCSPPTKTCSNPRSFWNVARLIPLAFFLPNLTIAIVVTFLGAMNKALRVIG